MSDPLEQHLRDAERAMYEMLARLKQAKMEANRLNSTTLWRIDALIDRLELSEDGEEIKRTLPKSMNGLIQWRIQEIGAERAE